MGPFELMDLIGIDVNLAAARGVVRGFRYAAPLPAVADPGGLVAAGRLGRKSGEGFYRYATMDAVRPGSPPTPSVSPEPGLVVAAGRRTGARLDRLARSPSGSILAIVNEAYRAVGEEVATADDIDRAMRLGAGHPFGPFERTAALGGPAAVLVRLDRWQSAGPRFVPAPALLEAARSTT